MSHLRVMAMSKEVEGQLNHGKAVEELIKQDKNAPVPIENQLIYLYAWNLRVLDSLSPFLLSDFKREIAKFVESRHPGFLEELRTSKELSDSAKRNLDECIRQYFEVSKSAQAFQN